MKNLKEMLDGHFRPQTEAGDNASNVCGEVFRKILFTVKDDESEIVRVAMCMMTALSANLTGYMTGFRKYGDKESVAFTVEMMREIADSIEGAKLDRSIFRKGR